jgi:hypothetical protein
MQFDSTLDKAANMYFDLLADTLAWQVVIADHLISCEAEKKGCDRNEIVQQWNEKKLKTRSEILDQTFIKHGPDLTKDLGL